MYNATIIFSIIIIATDLRSNYVMFVPIPLPEQILRVSCCTHFLYTVVLQTILGMGMDMNVTAQWWWDPLADLAHFACLELFHGLTV